MKNNLYRIIAILTLILLTLLFFWKILLTNLILVGVDSFLYFYPYKAITTAALRQGHLPLWNSHLFMGAPLLANSQTGIFYPPNWLFIWLNVPKQMAWSIALHITLAGLFMFMYARLSLHLKWLAALVAAILFAFGGYLGAQVEHINQLNAAVWLPLLFLLYDFGVEQRRQKRWFWFLLLALVVALTLLAGHAQTVFISLFGLGLYALWRALTEPDNNRFRLHPSYFILLFSRYLWPLVIISILAVALAALQLIPTAELSSLSIRSGGLPYRDVISFSLSPTKIHYALLPPYSVDLSHIWDEAFGERVAFIGVSGLILALLGTLSAIWQRPARRYLFLAVSGLVLSLGVYSGPIYLALYYLVPGFNLFRVPPRWLLLVTFGMSILAAYGFNALQSTKLSDYLATSWHWLKTRWWRVLLFVALPAIFLLTLLFLQRPPFFTLILWLGLTLITIALIYGALRFKHYAFSLLIILLLIVELWTASQQIHYNHPTAPQAYHSLRNSIAFLQSADTQQPRDRFLSLSGIAYDPGDLHDLEQIFSSNLSPKGFYNLIIATKQKEVLFFNLPLVFGLNSVDGYDGGILPLSQFVTLQRLFLPADDLSTDGRLREKLRTVPPNRLLSLLNTRWIITDKVFDAWINGIFYDLQFPAMLAPQQRIATTDIPDFPATAIGIVSHLNGAQNLADGTPVAEVTINFADGSQEVIMLTTGTDTAEGNYSDNTAHAQANIGVAWPYGAAGVDYVAVYSLSHRDDIESIEVKALQPSGQFVLKGLSLINQPTNTSRSIILSTEGNYRQVHSGDVKIYENKDVLSRAFLVHQTQLVADDNEAIDILSNPNFNPQQTLVRVAKNDEAVETVTLGKSRPQDKAVITVYQPERVEILATLNTPGWLVLTDTYYPGWRAFVDGQPVDILPVNIMFRGVELPAGEHTVVFEYKPRSLQVGWWISGGALLILLGGLVITNKKQ